MEVLGWIVRALFSLAVLAFAVFCAVTAGFVYSFTQMFAGGTLWPTAFIAAAGLGWLIALPYVIARHTGKTLYRIIAEMAAMFFFGAVAAFAYVFMAALNKPGTVGVVPLAVGLVFVALTVYSIRMFVRLVSRG